MPRSCATRAPSGSLTEEPARARRRRVQAAATGVAVLEALARRGGRTEPSTEPSRLAAALREHPARLHSYPASSVAEDRVEQDPVSQQHDPGPEAILTGVRAMRQADPLRHQLRERRIAVIGDVYLPGIGAVWAPPLDSTDAVGSVPTVLGASCGFDSSPDRPTARLRRPCAARPRRAARCSDSAPARRRPSRS